MIHRRDFLKRGAICTGSAALSSRVAAAPPHDEDARASSYNYRRPSFKKGSRLLFIGDSITDMKWGRNEKDRNHYLGHSYVYLIASRLGVDMPEVQLEFFNRGHSGNRITDLRSRWQKDAIDMKPDLLSVLIGVNDRKVKKGARFDAEKWGADYRHILTRSREANPDLRIVLLDPFVLKTGWWMNKGGEWDASRTQIDQMRAVIAKLAKDFDAAQVPTQDVFDTAAKAVTPEHWIWDGVHPLPQGHELIARRWLDDVSDRWK